MSKSLGQILQECKNAEGSDFEGSRTYRIHISTAEQLIKDAFAAGKAEAQPQVKHDAIMEACEQVYERDDLPEFFCASFIKYASVLLIQEKDACSK